MTEKPRNILVTGGAGYIGSHTCKTLARHGFNPVTLDNLSVGSRDAVKWGALVEGDIADKALVTKTLRDYHIDAVIHFAAHAYVGESMQNPQKYFAGNVASTVAFFEVLLSEGVKKIVFSSSCATYGIPTQLPIPESHTQIPINPYGETKLFAEKMLRWYGELSGLGWVALRYFNVAGADPEGEIGENHDPETHIIPLAIMATQGKIKQFTVFGTDYATPDGTAVRDYIHVTDLADAHVRALNYLFSGGESTAFNLGTGTGYSVRQILNAVEHVTGLPCPSLNLPRRPGDPPVLMAGYEKAKSILGWEPKHSELNNIITTAYRWLSS